MKEFKEKLDKTIDKKLRICNVEIKGNRIVLREFCGEDSKAKYTIVLLGQTLIKLDNYVWQTDSEEIIHIMYFDTYIPFSPIYSELCRRIDKKKYLLPYKFYKTKNIIHPIGFTESDLDRPSLSKHIGDFIEALKQFLENEVWDGDLGL